MKNLVNFIVILVIITTTSCTKKKDPFSGYVPIGIEPRIEWISDNSTRLYLKFTLPVVLTNGDTVNTQFFDNAETPGYRILLHRNTHPRAKNEILHVHGCIDNGNYIIQEVYLK
ncbi:MAG: hypothetical protein KA007_02990 [Candidatus Pacebacteria bacterium]|nr:hypothetical protein [Candidatus Paceibacterota bacterium]